MSHSLASSLDSGRQHQAADFSLLKSLISEPKSTTAPHSAKTTPRITRKLGVTFDADTFTGEKSRSTRSLAAYIKPESKANTFQVPTLNDFQQRASVAMPEMAHKVSPWNEKASVTSMRSDIPAFSTSNVNKLGYYSGREARSTWMNRIKSLDDLAGNENKFQTGLLDNQWKKSKEQQNLHSVKVKHRYAKSLNATPKTVRRKISRDAGPVKASGPRPNAAYKKHKERLARAGGSGYLDKSFNNDRPVPANDQTKQTYRRTDSYQTGVHLPQLDNTVKNLVQKPQHRRPSLHSVRSSHSLSSIKNAISDMETQIHGAPIVGKRTMASRSREQQVPPTVDESTSVAAAVGTIDLNSGADRIGPGHVIRHTTRINSNELNLDQVSGTQLGKQFRQAQEAPVQNDEDEGIHEEPVNNGEADQTPKTQNTETTSLGIESAQSRCSPTSLQRRQSMVQGISLLDSEGNPRSDSGTSETLHPPFKPAEAINIFKETLTDFERTEIYEFQDIFFTGTKDCEKIQGNMKDPTCNHGYDDAEGVYAATKATGDHIGYRYEIMSMLGQGSFGAVVKVKDHKTNDQVALKIIRNKKRFHQQALIEVKILNVLKNKDEKQKLNVIHIIDYFYFRNHLCITFELLGMNLYELIKKNNFHGFSLNVVRRIAIALLKCLYALYEERLLHCDLKPENILIYPKGEGGQNGIKVIDFGSSCYEHERVYTYIQSRFYRAPEVILGAGYGLPIDMWSFACILVELYNGLPIFPGENEHEQMACFMEVLGMPPDSLLSHSNRKRIFFNSNGEPRQMTNSRGNRRKVNGRKLERATGCTDANFLDFIRRCFEWDPDMRMTPLQAIRHEWIRKRKPVNQASVVGES